MKAEPNHFLRMEQEYLQSIRLIFADVRSKKMFGGTGIYRENIMFAFIMQGELYLRSSHAIKRLLVHFGCTEYLYIRRSLPIKLNYLKVAPHISRRREFFDGLLKRVWRRAQEQAKRWLERDRQRRIKDLPNLSRPYEQLLRRVEVHTVDELRALGACLAFLRLKLRLSILDLSVFLKLYAALENRFLCTVSIAERNKWLGELAEASEAKRLQPSLCVAS